MSNELSSQLLSQLSEFVADRIGLHFSKERWPDLERGIRSVMREFEFDDAESCAQWLVSSPVTQSTIETLASHLTVGETYFFREQQPAAFAFCRGPNDSPNRRCNELARRGSARKPMMPSSSSLMLAAAICRMPRPRGNSTIDAVASR